MKTNQCCFIVAQALNEYVSPVKMGAAANAGHEPNRIFITRVMHKIDRGASFSQALWRSRKSFLLSTKWLMINVISSIASAPARVGSESTKAFFEILKRYVVIFLPREQLF
jgi:hypothetical protein